METSNTVEEYIASCPKELQKKLQELREAIRAAAPDAQEKISYSMPYYDYKGRIAYFRLSKKHIGLYIPGSIVEDHAKELSEYETSKATIHFLLHKELPIQLIKKLIKERVRLNDNN